RFRYGAIEVDAGRVISFPAIVKDVKLHCHAAGDAHVTQAAAVAADLGRPDTLDHERETIGVGAEELKGERGREIADVDCVCGKGGPGLVLTAVSELKQRTVNGRAVESKQTAGSGEAV